MTYLSIKKTNDYKQINMKFVYKYTIMCIQNILYMYIIATHSKVMHRINKNIISVVGDHVSALDYTAFVEANRWTPKL